MRLSLPAALLFVAPLGAQVVPDHAIVISRTTAPALSALFDVDLATGAISPINRFSLDQFPPLAVAVDGVNRDVVVALLNPAGSSTLVRLGLAGAQVVQQTTLGDVPGVVTSLAQGLAGAWITTTDSGVMVTERNGGVARSIAPLSLATAIETFGLASFQAVVAQSGSATSDPQVRWINLQTGQTIAGPWVYAGYMPRGMNGVSDLPTGQSRQVLSQEDGTIAISVNFANPVALPLTPVLPPGATTAMHMRGLDGVALGGSAHPFLKSFKALGGTQWTNLAGPIAGDPVDFAYRPAPQAATVEFGISCGTLHLSEAPGGPPRIGNAGYGLQLNHAMPSSVAVLLVGVSDQRFSTLRLPLALPGGCQALCSGEIVLASSTSTFGDALATIGIPNSVALVDAIAFAQWFQVPGPRIDTSNAAAVWIGR